ncbi:MAG: hypothetical protein F6K03_05700 [Kamptonema sp. SIO4C4]|nr:hypothetical protein [Kamptonema sp. SIO4C4]
MSGKKPLCWQESRNWAVSELSTRGMLSASVRDRNVLLIGAGAIGAVVGELLVRGGVKKMLVIDGDAIEAGNLVRHPLSLQELGKSKAKALAGRLNSCTPHVVVDHADGSFPLVASDVGKRIDQCDLIVDCSGSDDVLAAMSSYPFGNEAAYVSVSMGRGARRLYLFIARETTFPAQEFHAAIAPWLHRDRQEVDDDQFPWEGIGCWHPVFPARADDVWTLAGIAVREIDKHLLATSSGLFVFSRDHEGNAEGDGEPANG